MTGAISRRRLIGALGVGSGGLLLDACDRINASPTVQQLLGLGANATMSAQRIVTDRTALAPEFSAADMSPVFRTNGTSMPTSTDYAAHLASGFRDWRLVVDGLVARPLQLSLDQIRRMPVRTQITRHDCVEGWSAIGKWSGVPLRLLLDQAGLGTAARYIVFHCADDFGGVSYYESIDLIDAWHPQTILAWRMNDQLLDVGHGAPLRLRVERQLGYKQAKYVMRVEAVQRSCRHRPRQGRLLGGCLRLSVVRSGSDPGRHRSGRAQRLHPIRPDLDPPPEQLPRAGKIVHVRHARADEEVDRAGRDIGAWARFAGSPTTSRSPMAAIRNRTGHGGGLGSDDPRGQAALRDRTGQGRTSSTAPARRRADALCSLLLLKLISPRLRLNWARSRATTSGEKHRRNEMPRRKLVGKRAGERRGGERSLRR